MVVAFVFIGWVGLLWLWAVGMCLNVVPGMLVNWLGLLACCFAVVDCVWADLLVGLFGRWFAVWFWLICFVGCLVLSLGLGGLLFICVLHLVNGCGL